MKRKILSRRFGALLAALALALALLPTGALAADGSAPLIYPRRQAISRDPAGLGKMKRRS